MNKKILNTLKKYTISNINIRNRYSLMDTIALKHSKNQLCFDDNKPFSSAQIFTQSMKSISYGTGINGTGSFLMVSFKAINLTMA